MKQEKKLQVQYVPTELIIPYSRNNKKHPPEQIEKLALQIKEHGWDVPIVVDEDNIIIKGHGRLLAAKKLKLKHVPCIVREDLTEPQKRAARLADNRIAELATIDLDSINFELEFLQRHDMDLELTGFDDWHFELPTHEYIEGENQNGDRESSDKDNNQDDNKIDNTNYTKKIEAPIYTPKRETKPSYEEIADTEKAFALIKEIEGSSIPKQDKDFLKLAAYRHLVFNYENIAEYYCHSSKEVQELMEKSALVIIDFNKAIEYGFVRLSENLASGFAENEQIIESENMESEDDE